MKAAKITTSHFMRKYALLVGVWSLLGVLYFIYLNYGEYGNFSTTAFDWHLILLSILLANAVGWLIRFVDHLLNKVLSWRSLFFTRFMTGFVVNTIVATAVTVGIGLLSVELLSKLSFGEFYQQWHEEIWKLGILIVLSVLLYEIFYGWFYSYRYFVTTQVEHLQSERVQLELQFESLKNQISPHYLFNCLNTISSLLYNENREAEEFIRRMADTFKYVISNQKRQLVTLKEEIDFVKAYYYLLQVRFQANLQLDINLPSNLMQTLVPPLAIQILVENGVKHNEISKNHPLFIYISAQDNTYINVSCTKTISAKAVTSFKIGLDNVKNRYRYFSDEEIIVKDRDKFIVQLPVIKSGTSDVPDAISKTRTA